MDGLTHVRRKLRESIAFFTRKRNHNRARVIWFAVASTLFSALATIVIAAKEFFSIQWFSIVAIAATSLATVIGVIESVLAYRRLWDINNIALADLYKLQRQLDFALAEKKKPSLKQVNEWFTELDQILSDADMAWIDTYSSK